MYESILHKLEIGLICAKGGGGGGGSGQVSHSAYLEAVHGDWLDQTGVDTISDSITDVMNSALGSSPFAALAAYDPDADVTAYEASITAFAAILAGIVDTTDWDALYTQAETTIDDTAEITEAVIVADVDAFADQLDDEISTKVLPRYRAGMRNIDAVVSSAFPIGEAIIEGFRNRDVAKHNSAIRLNAAYKNADIRLATKNLRLEGTKQMLSLMIQRINWEKSYIDTVIESKRIKIIAKKEETDVNRDIDKQDAVWDLEVFQYGANLLAAIGGGVATTTSHKPSTAQSAIGGAMSGAVAGAIVTGGNPFGIAIGAALGGASAFL